MYWIIYNPAIQFPGSLLSQVPLKISSSCLFTELGFCLFLSSCFEMTCIVNGATQINLNGTELCALLGRFLKARGHSFVLFFTKFKFNLNCFQIWPFFLSLVRTHRMHVLALFFIQGIFSCVLSKGRFTHSPLLPGWGFSSFQNPLPSPISALGGNVDWKPRNMEPRLGKNRWQYILHWKFTLKSDKLCLDTCWMLCLCATCYKCVCVCVIVSVSLCVCRCRIWTASSPFLWRTSWRVNWETADWWVSTRCSSCQRGCEVCV